MKIPRYWWVVLQISKIIMCIHTNMKFSPGFSTKIVLKHKRNYTQRKISENSSPPPIEGVYLNSKKSKLFCIIAWEKLKKRLQQFFRDQIQFYTENSAKMQKNHLQKSTGSSTYFGLNFGILEIPPAGEKSPSLFESKGSFYKLQEAVNPPLLGGGIFCNLPPGPGEIPKLNPKSHPSPLGDFLLAIFFIFALFSV